VGARRGRSAAKTNANTANRETTAASSQSEQSDGNSDNNAEKARQRLIEKQEKQWLPGCAEYRRRIRATVRMAC
jgi:hypothetical protein